MEHHSHEKVEVAVSSLLAALVLTTAKFVVGIATNSLGILSEALHSLLDLMATGMTLWAVRVADRPADEDHRYGHGKFENLSALAETALLLVVCVWVIYEAARRLFFSESVEIEPNIWAFLVVLGAIGVDMWRSRWLHWAAEKYSSQALEADALHFSTDIWSSSVVLLGLICVVLADWFDQPWLLHADALAGVFVAVLVSVVCLRLGIRAVDALTDRTSRQVTEVLERCAAEVPGVEGVRDLRVRQSGAGIFADLTVLVARNLGLEFAHQVASDVAAAIQKTVPGADVVVHVEPVRRPDEDAVTAIRVLAAGLGLAVHDVQVLPGPNGHSVELHVEVDSQLNLERAHELATQLEASIRESLPQIDRVLTHIEPTGTAGSAPAPQDARQDLGQFADAIAEFGQRHGVPLQGHQFTARQTEQGTALTFHLHLDGDLPIGEAHEVSRRLEGFLHQRFPQLARVVIHVEPRPNAQHSPVHER